MSRCYKTVEHYAEEEIIIEKSRFIGYIQPVSTEEEAEEFIHSIKSLHKEATHNVPVYLVGEKHEVQRYSDDGEPSGTAGVPVLEMLKREGITNIAIVITRYFGGVKLGTGGLVRAYTLAAKKAIEKAEVINKVEHQLIKVKVDYSFLGKIQSTLMNEGFSIKETAFDEAVSLYIYSVTERTQDLIDTIVNITNGQCHTEYKSIDFLTLKEKIIHSANE